MDTHHAIGLMSGSSLDGVDLAYCIFTRHKDSWDYEIRHAETIPYEEEWKMRLQDLGNQQSEELIIADHAYGKYLGALLVRFCDKHQIRPEIIASHGHTIFHNPSQGYTFQLGHGQVIASETGMITISDFRTKDIQLGGQGAPLVPMGDQLLFSDYTYCLNLGGIANISFADQGKRVAFDICGANQLLNHLSRQVGKPYDPFGTIAQLGKLNLGLFNDLNADPFFDLPYPKSLSNQKVQETFVSIIDAHEAPVTDKLYTVVKHIAYQVKKALHTAAGQNMLASGGGAHNTFLISALRRETLLEVIVPDPQITDFKEAMIFAFLGVLRLRNEINCLASATGARCDSSCGTLFKP